MLRRSSSFSATRLLFRPKELFEFSKSIVGGLLDCFSCNQWEFINEQHKVFDLPANLFLFQMIEIAFQARRIILFLAAR